MKAWVFSKAGQPLKLLELSDPIAGPGEVVVEVKAAGLCHSDVGMIDGHLPGIPLVMPIVLGHEIAGVVSATGPGVHEYAVGDRVAVLPLPPDLDRVAGLGRNGGFAEKTVVDQSFLIHLADELGFTQAAAGTDAGSTSYRAVMAKGQVGLGMRVGIIGLGGLGMIGARLAVLAGAEVWAAEPNVAVHGAAGARGVHHIVRDASELAGCELDVVIDFAGFNTTQAALRALRRGGRVVQVGAGQARAEVMVTDLIQKELDIVSSTGMAADDAPKVFELLNSGDLTLITHEIAFDDIPDGLDRVRRGEAGGRLVALIGS